MKRKFLLFVLLILVVYSCKYYINKDFRQNYKVYNERIHEDTTKIPYFKVHFKNGDVSVLDRWNLNRDKDSLIGQGRLYDFNRYQFEEGDFSFDLNDIAIIETNKLEPLQSKDKGRISALTILTAVNVIGDIVCITNPKACFGSCPTFYVEGNSNVHSVNAEGFSSSISPSLETADLDALQVSTSAESIGVSMKNEAFETHMVNQLYIDAIPKRKEESVFHDKQGNYYRCGNPYSLQTGIAGEMEIGNTIRRIDEYEYFSPTDSLELSTKEEIIVDFGQVSDKELGIVINFRQTLLTTFLLYSGLSYMGDEVGDYFAKIETNKQIKKRLSNPFNRLGKIRLSLWNEEHNNWEFIDEIYETGPIAKNLMIIPIHRINQGNKKAKIKIELTKGLWRLDYVGLTEIIARVEPKRTIPFRLDVLEGEAYTIDDVIHDDKNYLISLPGNEFKFHFRLPALDCDFDEHELFISSKGYYLEWMRQDWVKNKNISKLKNMLLNDADTWMELAKEYKLMEQGMEEVFWNSKFSPLL